MRTSPVFRNAAIMAASATIAISLTSCAPAQSAQHDEPHIVVTTGLFGDIVEAVAGDSAEVTVLIPAGSDPHDFAPSSQDIHTLHTADLVIAVGAGFEEALEAHLHAAATDGVTVLELAEHVDLRENEELYGATHSDHADETHADDEHSDDVHSDDGHAGEEHADDTHVDDTHAGDQHDHGPVDPHFWHNPLLVEQAVTALAEKIGTIDGVDGAEVQSHADAYVTELTALDEELAATFAQIPEEDRVLITQHHVLGYLAERYGFTTGGAIIPSTSTLAQSSAADLHALVKQIDVAGVRAVFTDVTQSDALAQTIAGEVQGAQTFTVVPLYTEAPSATDDEAGTYLDMMRLNAKRITEALAQ